MVVFPNAKINLGLHILFKRNDGFHELETVMLPIELTDILEIIPAEKTTLNVTGVDFNNCKMEDNLVYKAWKLMRDMYTIPNVEIHLHKKIPSGAGLGGGSADAAYSITLLNNLFSLRLSNKQMEEHAAQLGSDCAFFIRNQPALAFGRGEKLESIQVNLKGKYFVLIVPNIHISTEEAYSGIKPKQPKIKLKEVLQKPISEWKNLMFNNFEEHIFKKHFYLQEIKEMLYQNGAIYASMSGSGSSMFGIFDKNPEINNIDQAKCVKTFRIA